MGLSLGVYFITPKQYTAHAIVYPTSSNRIDDMVSDPSFGFEIQADRTIQLFESQMMKDKLVAEFNLMEYYELDSNSNDWFYKLNTFFARDITFSRTQYQSVLVRVKMKDPVMAANVANTAVSYLDTIQKALFMENLIQVRDEIASNVAEQQQELDLLLISIMSSDSVEATDNPISENKLNQLMFQQQIGATQSGDAIIIEALKEHPSFLLEKQINDYYIKLNTLNALKTKLEDIEKTIALPFPGLYVVSEALPDSKPTSPKLFWNLGFGLLIGLVLSISFVLTRAGLRNIKASVES
jgi:uncharacterized protein involved in exopolysaccharide biosynthesis